MLEPAHLRLSIGLRFAAAIELRNPPALDPSLQLLESMFAEIDRTAEKLIKAGGDHKKQVRLVDTLIAELHELVEQPGGGELAPMVGRLEQRIRPDSAAGAAGIDNLCGLVKICDYVIGRVRELYARQLDATEDTLPRPLCEAKCVRSDSRHAYFGDNGDNKFGVNALTRIDAEKILVCIELKPKNLDIAAAAQTLYLLVHETVCHAYQSLDGVCRSNSDDTCAWSDGWMDTLAWRLTERWIVKDAPHLPDWLTDKPENGKRWCRTFHDRRYLEPRCAPMREGDLEERCQARESFEALCGLWDKALPYGADIESHRATVFSLLLNHCDVADKTRRLLIAELNTALNRRQPRWDDVAGVCSEFIEYRDPGRLLEDLTALNELSSTISTP